MAARLFILGVRMSNTWKREIDSLWEQCKDVRGDLIPSPLDPCWNSLRLAIENIDLLLVSKSKYPPQFSIDGIFASLDIDSASIYCGITQKARPDFFISIFAETYEKNRLLRRFGFDSRVFGKQINWEMSANPTWEDIYAVIQDFAFLLFVKFTYEKFLLGKGLKEVTQYLETELFDLESLCDREWDDLDPLVVKRQKVLSARQKSWFLRKHDQSSRHSLRRGLYRTGRHRI